MSLFYKIKKVKSILVNSELLKVKHNASNESKHSCFKTKTNEREKKVFIKMFTSAQCSLFNLTKTICHLMPAHVGNASKWHNE